MRPVNKLSAFTFRPRSVWRRHLVLSAAAFGLTAAAVYFFSQHASHESERGSDSKAIAILEYKPVGDQAVLSNGVIFNSPANLKNIKTRVLSPSFIRQALSDALTPCPSTANGAHATSSAFVERVVRGLGIRTEPDAASGKNVITLELALKDCHDADRIVGALADRFVLEYRAFWSSEALKAYRDASTQADKVLQIHSDATELLQAYEDYVVWQETTPPEQPPLNQGDQRVVPQIAENPVRAELDRKLASLRDREKAMLEIKTPLHPDVQEIQERIADFQEQLDSTPRFAPEVATSNPIRQMESSVNPVRPQIQAADAQEQLEAAVENAEHDYLEKLACKQKLFETAGKAPSFSVNVSRIAMGKPWPGSEQGFMGLLLFSGFAMALGTGVFSSGVTSQSVLATIADLEPLLPVPIIGLVPDKQRLRDPVARRRRRTFLRWALIVSGGLVVLGCSLGLCWYFAQAVR